MTRSREQISNDVLAMLANPALINNAIRATDFFNIKAIRKTLGDESIKADTFDFVRFIHSENFDSKEHLKTSHNLLGIWGSLKQAFTAPELYDAEFIDEIFEKNDDPTIIRKAIMLQAVYFNLESTYLEKVSPQFLRKQADNPEFNPLEFYKEAGVNISSNGMLNNKLQPFLQALTAMQVRQGYLADLNQADPFKARREKRSNEALVSLNDILMDPLRLQESFVSINPFISGESYDERMKVDWLKFLFSDQFDPRVHLRISAEESMAGRVWKTLASSFSENELKSYGITQELLFDSDTVTPHLRIAIVFYIAAAAIEKQYNSLDREDIKRISLHLAAGGSKELETRLREMRAAAISTGRIITQNHPLEGKFSAVLLLLDKVYDRNILLAQDKKPPEGLPPALQKKIVQNIDKLYNEIADLEKGTLSKLFTSKIDLKRKKLDVLSSLLYAPDLKHAYNLVESLKREYKNSNVLDGNTGNIFNEIDSLHKKNVVPALKMSGIFAHDKEENTPAKTRDPMAPDSAEQSPEASPKSVVHPK